MDRGSFLRLLMVVLLCVSQLVCLNAVPSTRTRNLMHESQNYEVSDNTHLGNTKGSLEEASVLGRMDVELHDYPGSGANNRHNPIPRPWKACADC